LAYLSPLAKGTQEMRAQVQISPSIAAGNLMRLEEEVRKLESGGADSIHFDCMDGHFVPLLTLGVPLLEQVRAITSLSLDVHIMVSNPEAVWEDYIRAGADTLTFHPEVARHAHRLCQAIRDKGKRSGVALNPGTPWQSIQWLLPVLDQVTVMAVNPGYSRQPHIPEMSQKVAELVQHCQREDFKIDIQVDGGVNPENARGLIAKGASVLVAGGAVMGKPDYRTAINALRGT
jgi:ribulose-phosphate 3-epimerase